MAVYRRNNGKVFYMNFTVKGQRVFRSTGQTTKREARLAEAAEKQKLLNNIQVTPQEDRANTLLADAVDIVYDAKWQYGKDSIRSYRKGTRLVELMGNVPLKEIDDQAVAKLVHGLEQSGATTATVNRYLAALKTILRHLRQATDPVCLRKERKGRIRTLSKDEEGQVVNLLRHTPHSERRAYFVDVADLVEVLIDSGMRLGEALALKYEDVNFASNLLSIWINKGDRPRSIPMTSRVRTILKSRQINNHLSPFSLKPHQGETAWRWVRETMGIDSDKEFVLHSLRHTCATRLVNLGVDLYVVKEILGHSSIRVTEKYAHLAPQKLVEALSVLEAS